MYRAATAGEARAYLEHQTCACGKRDFGRDPVLAEHDGAVVMRFAGCAACQQPPWYDAGLPEEHEQLARDALSRSAMGTSRVIDPGLALALAPFVAAGFPSYFSAQEQTWGMRRTSIDGFPTGPGWRIVTWLRGSTAFGQARMQNDDGTRALGTVTKPQTQSSEQIASNLAHATPGVAPLIAIRTLGGHGLLLEREPDGIPLSTPMFPMPLMFAVPLFGQLVGILADAASRGEVMRGLRPELVYFDRVNDAIAVTGIAPRAERFASGVGATRDLSPSFPFDSMFEAPEMIRGDLVGPAADVFSACATVVFALQRRSPFGSPGVMMPQLAAITTGRDHVLPPLPSKIDAALRAGLGPDPDRRPSAADLAAILATV